jgi:general secretion pathway protein G
VLLGALPGIVLYRAQSSRQETDLRNNLHALRSGIDAYTLERRTPPQTLQDLVSAGYLSEVPVDPMTGSDRTWQIVNRHGGIYDVSSASRKAGSNGMPFSKW